MSTKTKAKVRTLQEKLEFLKQYDELIESGANTSEAASILGLHNSTLNRMLKNRNEIQEQCAQEHDDRLNFQNEMKNWLQTSDVSQMTYEYKYFTLHFIR
uniref:HTH psq-type domain-containing protein n=1 Tax=Trichogramma kaykai TaxID=54128 RepID=A0ABD2X8L1_9HYME